MKFKIIEWDLLKLYKRRNKINFPIFQRENIWSEGQNILLIDSIFRGIDIPKLYLQKVGKEGWDCIDGQQRIRAISGFFNNGFKDKENKKRFSEMSDKDKQIFENYKLTIANVYEIDEEEIRELFLRLQLGVPTNSGEKLNAIRSNIRDFVSQLSKTDFVKNLSIPSRRFSKEQVCAQIINNSKYLNKTGDFLSSKYEDLEILYRRLNNIDLNSKGIKKIRDIMNKLYALFGSDSTEIRNRASAVSLYLIFEELDNEGHLRNKEKKLKEFYLKFLKRLKEESLKGVDAKNRFLISYQNKIIQGADSRTSIKFRHDWIKEAFEYYLKNNKILGD